MIHRSLKDVDADLYKLFVILSVYAKSKEDCGARVHICMEV